LIEQRAHLFGIGPEVRLQFGKDEHAVDFDFKGAVLWEGDEVLPDLVVVPFHFHAVCGAPTPVFGEVFGRFIFTDGDMFEDRLSFVCDAVEEVLVLFFVVTRTPVMKMAIDAVLNLDMHRTKIIIFKIFLYSFDTN
jgi:hypothetical protein